MTTWSSCPEPRYPDNAHPSFWQEGGWMLWLCLIWAESGVGEQKGKVDDDASCQSTSISQWLDLAKWMLMRSWLRGGHNTNAPTSPNHPISSKWLCHFRAFSSIAGCQKKVLQRAWSSTSLHNNCIFWLTEPEEGWKHFAKRKNMKRKKLLSSYSGENVAQHWSIMQSSVVPSHLSWAALRPHCAVSFALLLTFWLRRHLAGAHWPKDATTDTNLTLDWFQWSQKTLFSK